MTDTNKFTLSEIDTERAVVTYLNLVTIFENREEITFEKFSSYWNKLFSKGGCRFSDDMKLRAYDEAKNILGDMSVEKFRNIEIVYVFMKVHKYQRIYWTWQRLGQRI